MTGSPLNSERVRAMEPVGMFRRVCFVVACVFLMRGCLATDRHSCPASSCPVPDSSLDLSPLTGTWQAVYFAESELGESHPHFFNISICGSVDHKGPNGHCEGSSVCYSEFLDRHYSVGTRESCQYSYGDREVELVFQYSEDASGAFGEGNVTVTLVCGRTLGVPEVISGDPSDHAIEILWITSAACKKDSLFSVTDEMKCYTINAYQEDGLKAKLIDLTPLIQTSGYEVTYAERKEAQFLISVCRPIQSAQHPKCNGSMMCMIQTDSHFDLGGVYLPLPLASINASNSSVRVESDFPTVMYGGAAAGCDGGRRVKVNYICPSGNEDLGPTISFLDNKLCLIVVSWYTFHACGTQAIQSSGCKLTTGDGTTFDLTGLSTNLTQVNGTAPSGQNYTYAIQICSGNKVNSQCGVLESTGVRVAQIDYQNHGVCHSLGRGDGKIRYADGVLSLTYPMGDSCHSNFHRTTTINFVCPESVNQGSSSNQIRFLNEDSCLYEFEWTTPLACGSQTSGASDCQFELSGNTYNFAPLMGESDKNWVAVDEEEDTECYMVNPCGELSVTEDSHSPADYCNDRVAPQSGCVGCSVCQIRRDGGTKCIGKFDLQDPTTLSSIDGNVLTIQGNSTSKTDPSVAVVHYVCKTGDFSTPPVFVDITNEKYYEFHWTTMAACPQGIHVGEKCAVQHETTGYMFNATSLSGQYSFTSADKYYTYDVSICGALKEGCHSNSKAGACQKYNSHERTLGHSNSSLTYSDGTLFLQYRGGDTCTNGGERNATVLLECDVQAHKPTIAAVNEVNHCEYAIEMHTKLACPPAYRATECIHFDKNHTYDFSELAKSVGNWQAEDSRGSQYYINLCQPLNKVAGCSPLAAVCRVRSVGGKTEYTNLGWASSAAFSVAGQSGNEKKSRVVLTYTTDVTNDKCSKVYSRIEFICSASSDGESGPVYQSGGDEDNPCEYSFSWETPGACPIRPAVSHTCSVRDPESGHSFDLSPLGDSQNHFAVSNSDGSYRWDIALCSHLNYTCHNLATTNVSVCQNYEGHQRSSGKEETRRLQYFDGSLSLRFSGGELCSSNGHNRATLINFECDRSVLIGEPRYIQEADCEYSFEWPTALACPPRELECVADGGRYDLRPLLSYQNWMVSTSGGYQIVVGGCRSLDFKSLPNCPQVPGMGACLYPKEGHTQGVALGYMLGDIVEEVSGVLRLSYYNGDKCPGGRSHVVNVFFQCDKGSGAGVPVERDTNNLTCVTNIDWLTEYACPLDAANPGGWNITNPVTHETFDLRDLSPSLSQIFEENGDRYNYTIGLTGHQISCGGGGWDYHNPIGACQTRLDSGKAYVLGRINNTLQFIGEELRVEYRNGNFCHHANAPRKAVLTFVCNRTAPKTGYLEVLPEEECEYTFNVHTPKACKRKGAPMVECFVPGYANLGSFTSLRAPAIAASGGTVYVAVCGPIAAGNQVDGEGARVCPYGAAACLVRSGKPPLSLGQATSDPTLLDDGSGVVLEYTNGSACEGGGGGGRMRSSVVLTCDKDIPTGVPQIVTSDDCSYTLMWRSALACPVEIYSTKTSKDLCSITDPDTNNRLVFQSITSQHVSIPDSDTIYHIQLCGSNTKPPQECGGSDIGICRTNKKGKETLVHADHKFVITSHAPHIFEVVYDVGETCDSQNDWSATVTLACKWRGGTSSPVFLSAEDCNLRFIWKSSLFCVGPEYCAATDGGGYVYDLDGLMNDTWSGLVHGQEGRFELGVCRNINPFSPGPHCSSPAGICWHKSDTEHINLGHMTKPPVYVGGDFPHIILSYSDGDNCSERAGGGKHSTTVSLSCGPGKNNPLSLESAGPCQHTLDWETPYACKPQENYTSTCVWSDPASGLRYNLSSLATPLNISQGDNNIQICLCPSAACTAVGGAGVTLFMPKVKLGWGQFSELSVSSATSGPILTYTGGAPCRGSAGYKTVIFMECDRSSAPGSTSIRLQESMSHGCQKYFFWATPYACRTEQTSCTFSVKDKFFDFSPLHVSSGGKAWRVKHGKDEYFINLCGPLPETTGCAPDTAVCLYSSTGEWLDLGKASTQQIVSTPDNHIQIRFQGQQKCVDSYSHVVIDMVCGLTGLSFHSNDSCTYEFFWHTPYACRVDDSVYVSSTCEESTKSSDGLSFSPDKLKSSDGLTLPGIPTYGTFYINFCGPDSHCGRDSSVCFQDNSGQTTDVASYKYQKIMIQDINMWIQMNSTDGLSHAIIHVECVDKSADVSKAETIELDKVTNTGGTEKHTYYHFNMWTAAACGFTNPTETPPTSSPSNHDNSNKDKNGGGGSRGSSRSSSSSTILALLITVVVFIVAATILGFVFYKKERRDRFFNFLKAKSSEPVRYEKLPLRRTEETSLLEEGSSESDQGEEGSGGEGEGEGGGGGGGEEGARGEKKRPDHDEELIDL